jgi:hypothetical protein
MITNYRQPAHRAALHLLVGALALSACAGRVLTEPGEDDCTDCDAPVTPQEHDCDCSTDASCAESCRVETRPLPDEQPELGEDEACEALTDAYQRRGIELSCPLTIRVCPDYLRVEHGEACLAYDADSVADCIDRWRAADSCEQLMATACSVRSIPGSAPGGC